MIGVLTGQRRALGLGGSSLYCLCTFLNFCACAFVHIYKIHAPLSLACSFVFPTQLNLCLSVAGCEVKQRFVGLPTFFKSWSTEKMVMNFKDDQPAQ